MFCEIIQDKTRDNNIKHDNISEVNNYIVRSYIDVIVVPNTATRRTIKA